MRENAIGTNRRQWLRAAGGSVAMALIAEGGRAAALPAAASSSLGISMASYTVRWRAATGDGSLTRFSHTLDFLRHARRLGAGGVQTVIHGDADFLKLLRKTIEDEGLFLEGQVALPAPGDDLADFEGRLQSARTAGATIVRTVCLSGRRYETFESAAAFREFASASRTTLERVEPIVRRLGLRLAVENHKDWRVDELLSLLSHLDSEWIGVCLDTGNSIALLEDPMEVVEAYAPFAMTTHFKDMGVREYEDGFYLSEVSLGRGYLDLPRILATCRRANPIIRFNLEMITRDPLPVPCLTARYWMSLPGVPGSELARGLRSVRSHTSPDPLPTVAGLDQEGRLRLEESHVAESIAFARERLLL